jgi:argininosuccinate lyase
VTLSELTLDELKSEHGAFEADIQQALDPETALERRNLPGGPAKAQLQIELTRFRKLLGERGCALEPIATRYRVRTEP